MRTTLTDDMMRHRGSAAAEGAAPKYRKVDVLPAPAPATRARGSWVAARVRIVAPGGARPVLRALAKRGAGGLGGQWAVSGLEGTRAAEDHRVTATRANDLQACRQALRRHPAGQ